MRTRTTPIAVEGLPFVAVAGGLTLLCVLLSWTPAAAVLSAVTAFVFFFFRNPPRAIPAVENGIIAPADGVVIYLGPSFEEHLQSEVTKISIFMSVFNVHVNRAPMTGRIVDTFHLAGKFLDVRDERATFENEQLGIVQEDDRGRRIVCVQVAGLIARRIVSYLKPGDTITAGEIYGLIRFGSRLDVYLPVGTNVQVKLGEKTVAGETVLGILP